MILLLGIVDLADHVANSILARLVALAELSEPSGRAPPVSSHFPLSLCKLQELCCGDRLHATLFGKIASLSLERASNCTQILFFLKAFPSILVWRDPWFRQVAWCFSHTISIISIGFTVVKNTACLPFLRLFPPGIIPFLFMECNSLAIPTWKMYS